MNHKQRIFNCVWNHFIVREQGISMGDEFGEAMYYGPGNLRCSIGIFIPEDIYKPAMEGNDVETLLARWPMLVARMQERNLLPEDTEWMEFSDCIDFLVDIQKWHDEAERHGVVAAFKVGCEARQHLITIAEEHGLCCPPY